MGRTADLRDDVRAAFGALILSQSRGGWLGFGVTLSHSSTRAARAAGRFYSIFTLGWMLGGALAFVVLFADLGGSPRTTRARRIRDPDGAHRDRDDQGQPFGVGFNQYVQRMNAYDVTQEGLSYHFRFAVHNATCSWRRRRIWVLLAYLFFLACYYKLVFDLVAQPPGFPRVIGLAFAAGMVAAHLR